MNVLGIQLNNSANMSLDEFDMRLRKRGWALGVFRQWDLMRVVLMPHITRDHIDAFIKDVKTFF
ncbi:MAG: tyrosine decarboxylase MfnA, partial [Promethearchaeota archaeon]